jgi:phosphoribosyl 1,2-cyclic phosphate phosphodiesterase
MQENLKIIFLGTGTSLGIPIIGCDCAVCTSSDPFDQRLRSSVLLVQGNTSVVIDCGPDFRTQIIREKIKKIDAVVFTHEHRDHTAGLDDIRAFNYIHGIKIPVYATGSVHLAIRSQYDYVFGEHYYEGAPQIIPKTFDHDPFCIGNISLIPVPVRHADLPVSGFRCGDFAYITDASAIPEESMEKLKGLKILVLNALRKKPHFSHFSLTEALEIIRMLSPEKAYLTHISHMMGRHRDVTRELPDNVHLAYDGLSFTITHKEKNQLLSD